MNQYADIDEFLMHHGVKGMHWGVRRAGHDVKKGVSSSGKFTEAHPVGVGVTAGAAYIAYRKSGKLAAAVVIAGAIGGYELNKHVRNDPELQAKIAAGKKAVSESKSKLK